MGDRVAFATAEVGRIFICCRGCGAVKPHYEAYPGKDDRGVMGCRRCGHRDYSPRRIPEWRAAWWVLVVGWLWRKQIRRREQWDPRMPLRQT